MSDSTKNAISAGQGFSGGGYRCVDWDKEDIELYDYIQRGFESKNIYLTIMPCQTVVDEIGWTVDQVREDCIADY